MNQTTTNHAPHSPIRQVPKGGPNKGQRTLPDLMQDALPYIQKHEYHPVLFPALLRSLTRYIHVHSLKTTGDDPGNKLGTGGVSVSNHKTSSPPTTMMKRQGRRHSMLGSTPNTVPSHGSAPGASTIAPAPPANPPNNPPPTERVANESTGSSSSTVASRKTRQRRHSMLSTVPPSPPPPPPPSGSGHRPKMMTMKKPPSEFDGYPLPANKVQQSRGSTSHGGDRESANVDPRPVVSASPMRRRTARRHSISVPTAPPSYQHSVHDGARPYPSSPPRHVSSPRTARQQLQNLRLSASVRHLEQQQQGQQEQPVHATSPRGTPRRHMAIPDIAGTLPVAGGEGRKKIPWKFASSAGNWNRRGRIWWNRRNRSND